MDPYRYLTFMSRQIMRAWAAREQPPQEVAWTPLSKRLTDCRVAVISSAGIALLTDRPFDQQGERDDPWWGDPSWRQLPVDITAADVSVSHLHIDTTPVRQDLDVVLPLHRLRELVDAGIVGEISDRHYSIMGYNVDTTELTTATGPELASALLEDHVDLFLLVPV